MKQTAFSRRSLGRAALLALASLALPVSVAAQELRECARLVVVDVQVDSGTGMPNGGVLDVDLTQTPLQNTGLAGGSPRSVSLSHAAVAPGRIVYLSDLDADLSGSGPDPNGAPGRGGIFRMDPAGGPFQVVADGTSCGPGIVNCDPVTGVFVDPVAIAHSPFLDLLVVADVDADPSGFGPDGNGFAGHGAIFSVDAVSGTVDLIADGSNFPPGIPNGGPSVFEDPVGVAFSRDGRLFVADQLARPFGGSRPGAIFEIDLMTGEVLPLAAGIVFSGLRDLVVAPGGTLLVLDRLAGPYGILYWLDVSSPGGNVLGAFESPELVEPAGLSISGSGEIFVLDSSADPFGMGFGGALFQVDLPTGAITPVSSTPDYAYPISVDLLESENIDQARPAVGEQGQSLTVTLTGGIFQPGLSADFGADITVDAVRFISPVQVEVDITIAAGGALGPRDVRITNPDFTQAFHCDLFEVNIATGCAPGLPVGDTLRLGKVGERVRLEWLDSGDACTGSYRVYRGYSSRPAIGGGSFPTDPAFLDISIDDLEGDPGDGNFEHLPAMGSDEYYLIVPLGTDGLSLGDAGHYP